MPEVASHARSIVMGLSSFGTPSSWCGALEVCSRQGMSLSRKIVLDVCLAAVLMNSGFNFQCLGHRSQVMDIKFPLCIVPHECMRSPQVTRSNQLF